MLDGSIVTAGEVDEDRLDERVHGFLASDVVAVVREALANAARHAHASTVEVRLTAGVSDVLLEVQDDGVGIRPDPSRRSGTANLAVARSRPGRDVQHRAGQRGWRDAAVVVGTAGLTPAGPGQEPGSLRHPECLREATHAVTWVRRRRPIFARIAVMWFFTVFSTTPSCSAISRFDSPSPMRSTIRSSLGVSSLVRSSRPRGGAA